MTAQTRYCYQCGAEFEFKRADHHFCSGKCTAAYYRDHPNPEYIHAELPHDKPHVCEECGQPYDVNAYAERGGKRAPKYCSPKCKQKAYRRRGHEAQEQAERRYTNEQQNQRQQEEPRFHWEDAHREWARRYGRQEPPRQEPPRQEWVCTYQSACQLLNLGYNFTARQLSTAYRAAMKKYHPDVNHDANANEMAQRVNAAYTYLKNMAQN